MSWQFQSKIFHRSFDQWHTDSKEISLHILADLQFTTFRFGTLHGKRTAKKSTYSTDINLLLP